MDENGEEITIVFARSKREVRESELPRIADKTDELVDSVFTTETASPLAGFNLGQPQSKNGFGDLSTIV
jgi:hypothetical protein